MTMECKAFEEQQKTWGSGTERLMSFRRFREGSRIVKRIEQDS